MKQSKSKIAFCYFCLSLCFILFSHPSFIFAQENRPSDFFSEDFVTKDNDQDLRGDYFQAKEKEEIAQPEPVKEPTVVEPTVEEPVETAPSADSAIDRVRELKERGSSLEDRLSVIERLKTSLPGGVAKDHGTPVVRLFVAGYPSTHLAQYVEQLAKLKRIHNIKVDAVYVVVESLKINYLRQSGLFAQNAIASLEELSSSGVSIRPVKSIPSRFSFKYSPTWVVTLDGEDHVFEGYRSTSSFFPRTGEFDPSSIAWE